MWKYYTNTKVTPFVGVWIEILEKQLEVSKKAVTPFVGVWIEISVLEITI